MIETTVNLAPMIEQHFNRWLLDPLKGFWHKATEILEPLSRKKIRPQDVGRRREFDKLFKEFIEVYERKKAEEKEFEREVEKKSKERPRFPNAGATYKFKRFQP